MTTQSAVQSDRNHHTRLLILLSAVARMQGEWGMHTVASVLRGSLARRLADNELDKLPVYGLLADFTQAQLVGMLEALIATGLVVLVEHRCVGLTKAGVEVMRGERQAPEALETAFEEAMLCTAPPKVRSPNSPSVCATRQLLSRGLNPSEIAQNRGLSEDAIMTHIMTLYEAGERFDFTNELDAALLAELRELAPAWQPGEALKPIYEALEDPPSWAKLKLHLIHLASEN